LPGDFILKGAQPVTDASYRLIFLQIDKIAFDIIAWPKVVQVLPEHLVAELDLFCTKGIMLKRYSL
jgi:hypothetical protein